MVYGFMEYEINKIYYLIYDGPEQPMDSGQTRLPLTPISRRQHSPAWVVQKAGPTHIMAAAPPTPASPRAPAPSPAAAGKKVEAAVPDTARRANPPATTGKLTRSSQIDQSLLSSMSHLQDSCFYR